MKRLPILFTFLIDFFLATFLYSAKPPEISAHDVLETLHQMMEAHVSCKELNVPF